MPGSHGRKPECRSTEVTRSPRVSQTCSPQFRTPERWPIEACMTKTVRPVTSPVPHEHSGSGAYRLLTAPDTNHCTSVAARWTAARDASGVSATVGLTPPWRDV